MQDIKFIRENAETFDQLCARRNLPPQSAHILALDEAKRELLTELQHLQQERNSASKEIGKIKGQGGDATQVMHRVQEIKERMPELEAKADAKETEITHLLEAIPNILAEDVPQGADENDNETVRTWGEPARPDFEVKEHDTLGEALGLIDFTQAAHISGARFVVLKGALAKMERALVQLFLNHNIEQFGYTEAVPPLLVRENALYGTGQLPKFEEDVFKTTDDRYLIPTAEVPLTNLVADQVLPIEQLPQRYTAYTPCFRSEAGSAGRDTKGMIRQHQFSKVEMFVIATPEQAEACLDEIVAIEVCTFCVDGTCVCLLSMFRSRCVHAVQGSTLTSVGHAAAHCC